MAAPETITRESVAAWVDEHWDPAMALRAWWRALADAGLAFPTWPAGLGGRGATATEARTVQAVLAEKGVLGPPTGNAPNMGVPTMLAHGTPEQQARFVPPVARGEAVWAQLFSEPGAGSDLAGLACRAERDGDELVVTGQKVWNSLAHLSNWGMLLARTNPDAPKHAGISWMMIDMLQPGVEVRPLVQMNGSAEFCEVFLTEARVPLGNVIGGLDNGWNVARATLNAERASIGSMASRGAVQVHAGPLAGSLDRPVGDLLEQARRAAKDPSKRFDVMVGAKSMVHLARDLGRWDDPLVRNDVMRYWIASEVQRLTQQRGRDNAKGGRPGPEGSIGKLSLAVLAHHSRDLSMRLLGAEGMLVGDDARQNGKVQRACVSSFAPSLGGGTNEIQRNVLGERVLGLPREPSVDDDVPFRQLRRS